MIYAGIVAGGTGSRMGADRPKQFIELRGCPILFHTLRRFLESPEIGTVYTAVHPEWLGYTAELAGKMFQADELDRLRFIEGGADRNASVFNIISAIERDRGISPEDILLTHDGVRPFADGEIIAENIACAREHTVCTTAVPATDTILMSGDGQSVTDTPDRSKLYHAQTPQSFVITEMLSAYSKLSDEQKSRLTDVCGIFTAAGIPVHIVRGSVSNIKITTPFDLTIAEAILDTQ